MRLGDGNLFFIGRRDDQIKIHGYRIELAEVQRAIEQATGVEKASCIVYRVCVFLYYLRFVFFFLSRVGGCIGNERSVMCVRESSFM